MIQAQLSASQVEDQNNIFSESNKRILVIEDDPDISHLLEIHLKDNAYRVDVVNNGIDGFELACKHPCQLITDSSFGSFTIRINRLHRRG